MWQPVVRTSTYAYTTNASKFVTNYRVDKVKLATQELQHFCYNTSAHHFLAPFLGKLQSILWLLLSSISSCNILLIVYFNKSRLVISFLSVLHFLAFLFNFANFHSTSSFQLVAIFFSIIISISIGTFSVGKRNKNQPKIFPFMPCRNRDNIGKYLPNAPTTSHNQPSLFFGRCN